MGWPEALVIMTLTFCVHLEIGSNGGHSVGFGVDLARAPWRETLRSEEQEFKGLRFHFLTLERAS